MTVEARPAAAAPAAGVEATGSATARSRQLLWAGLALVLVTLPFLSEPGRYVADTRDALWFSPGTYLSRSFTLWQSSPYLGHEQRDAIVVPMGVVIALFRGLGLPMWAVERLWHGLLLFAAAGGTVLLVDQLRGRKTLIAPLVAGLLYTFTPYVFGFGLGTTGAFLPYVLLPFLLFVTARGLATGGLAGPVLFGLTVFLMGGGNGAPQVYAVLAAAAYAGWVVGVERTVSPRPALAFGGWALLFTLGLAAYWLFLLSASDVPNALQFTEQPRVINVASSYSESVRGLGFWAFYGGDRFGPWLPTVRRFIGNPLLILTGFAVPVAALASAWLVRWRARLFFLFLGIAGVVVMAGIFPVDSPTPFGRFLLWAYDHVPGAEGLRTTYKFGGALSLSLAVLVGVGAEEAWQRVRASARRVGWRVALAGAGAVVLLASSFPLWTGGLYNGARTAGPIPGYWQRALAELQRRQDGTRVFFAPGALVTTYRWGGLHEGLAAATPELPSVQRIPLPVGERYGSNLLAAVEEPYQEVIASRGFAALMRYLGVRDVVLQNDVDWERSTTARPADLQTLVRDPSLRPLTSFGNAGRNVTGPSSPDDPDIHLTRAERGLPPVQVLTVPDPAPVVRAEVGPPVVVSGDGFGIAALARAGLLADNPPILYSATLTPEELTRLAGRGAVFVITDSNRRRVWTFAAVRRSRSYTLPAGETLGGSATGFDLFGERPETQSVAEFGPGISVSTSGYGSPFEDQPELRPANAFDGDPQSLWLVGVLSDPVGEWIQLTFAEPRTVSRVTLVAPDLGLARRVRTARLEFSDGTSELTPVRVGTTVVDFTGRQTRYVRVRIVSVTSGVPGVENGVGLAEVAVPGVEAREVIRLPTDLLDTARQTALGLDTLDPVRIAYLFERARTDAALDADEETAIARRFEVPATDLFGLEGTAHLGRAAPDEEIDELLRGPTAVRVSSSSRLFDNPAWRGSAVLDGDPDTAWIPQGDAGESLRISFPERALDRIVVHPQVGVDRSSVVEVQATFSDGTSVTGRVKNLLEGAESIVLRFPSRETSEVRLEVTTIVPPLEGPGLPIGITEVEIPGVALPAVDEDAPLPCHTGEGFTIDGQPVAVRPVGTAGDLLAGRDLPLTACGDATIRLATGWHELRAGGSLLPDSILLASPPDLGLSRAEAEGPLLRVHPATGGYDVEVRGAAGPFYLVIGQSHDPGWRATVEGQSLGPPLVLDGYSAGWWVTGRGDYRISVRYGPQRAYTAGLVLSALALAAALGVLGFTLARGIRKGAP